MKTVVDDLTRFEDEIGITASSLRKVVPIPQYGRKLDGYNGHKLWSRLISLHVLLQRSLATSPMYSGAAARLLVADRVRHMQKVRSDYNLDAAITQLALENGLNPIIHAHLLVSTYLVLQSGMALPSYLLSPSEVLTYHALSTVWDYEDKIHRFALDLCDDLGALQSMYSSLHVPVDVAGGCLQGLWQFTLQCCAEVMNWHVGQSGTHEATSNVSQSSVQEKIATVHHSNVPYLWLDILRAEGHVGQVVDGPRDGSIDVDTILEGQRFISQVKAWRKPPIGAEFVRQHAQTCRTYGAHGYYVTTRRFARNAEHGVYPLLGNGAVDERQRIAEMQLVDLAQLSHLVIKHKIGITAAERFELRYWATMQLPRGRKLSEVVS